MDMFFVIAHDSSQKFSFGDLSNRVWLENGLLEQREVWVCVYVLLWLLVLVLSNYYVL